MFKKSIKLAQKSMFPIFKKKKLGSDQVQLSVMGTGFFINSDGVFVSVAHLFDDNTPGVSYEFRGWLPELAHNPALEITEMFRDDSNDIFIGQIPLKIRNFLRLDSTEPEIGDAVCVSGYPLAKLSVDPTGVLNAGEVRRYFQPSFILDRAVVTANTNGKTRTHNGFLMRDVGLFGMSGGPVFNEKGVVLGIQASVTAPRKSLSSDGRTISVENAVAIKSSALIAILRKSGVAYNLLGKWPLLLFKKEIKTV